VLFATWVHEWGGYPIFAVEVLVMQVLVEHPWRSRREAAPVVHPSSPTSARSAEADAGPARGAASGS
jgi:hypothetical protein